MVPPGLLDAGRWLGSIYNEECRIDALAQAWSVISGLLPERAQSHAVI